MRPTFPKGSRGDNLRGRQYPGAVFLEVVVRDVVSGVRVLVVFIVDLFSSIRSCMRAFCLFFLALNPCGSSPCYNGATCVNAGLDYICECPLGFAGDNCEIGTYKNRPVTLGFPLSASIQFSFFFIKNNTNV